MTVSYAIEPADYGRDWEVREFSESNLDGLSRTVVYVGTRAECEHYVRQHETSEEN